MTKTQSTVGLPTAHPTLRRDRNNITKWMPFYQSFRVLALLIVVCYASSKSTSLFGFVSENAVSLSSSTALIHNGVSLQDNFEWVRKIGNSYVGVQGGVTDCQELFSILEAQSGSHQMDFPEKVLSAQSLAHLCRSLISEKLRTKRRLGVSVMVAGWEYAEDSDGEGKPALYWLDDLGTIKRVQHGAHGPETAFLLSMLDQKDSILRNSGTAALRNGRQERLGAAALLTKSCWEQLQKRSSGKVAVHAAKLYCVDSSGCIEVPLPSAEKMSRGV